MVSPCFLFLIAEKQGISSHFPKAVWVLNALFYKCFLKNSMEILPIYTVKIQGLDVANGFETHYFHFPKKLNNIMDISCKFSSFIFFSFRF